MSDAFKNTGFKYRVIIFNTTWMMLYLGLAGKTELENLKVDIVIDTFEDAYKPISAYYRFEDGDKRKVK